MIEMEEEPREDSELAGAIRESVDAFRAGDNSTALNLLDRAIHMARESGDRDTYVRSKMFRSEQRDKFIRLDLGPEDDGGSIREPRRPSPGNDRGSLKAQNGSDGPAP